MVGWGTILAIYAIFYRKTDTPVPPGIIDFPILPPIELHLSCSVTRYGDLYFTKVCQKFPYIYSNNVTEFYEHR